MVTIRELQTEQEWLEAFPVMNELRVDLNKDSFVAFTKDMVRDGYRLFAIYDNEQVVGVTGVALRVNYYYGKHIFVYDLVTSSTKRSKGYGKILLDYIHGLALENECKVVALESGLHRVDAHRFYELKMGYEKFCYSFKKNIGNLS